MSGNPSEDGSPSRKHRVSSMKAQADISTKLDAFFYEVSGVNGRLSAIEFFFFVLAQS